MATVSPDLISLMKCPFGVYAPKASPSAIARSPNNPKGQLQICTLCVDFTYDATCSNTNRTNCIRHHARTRARYAS